MKYFIKTFGCQMNENDSLLIGALLQKNGHVECRGAEDADIIIVNTCCVRQNAENRALGYLGSIKHLKEQNSELIIAVCGCMIQKEGVAEMLSLKYRHVGIIIGTFASALLPDYIDQYAIDHKRIINVAENYEQPGLEAPDRCLKSYKAQVNINFGCNNFCSYCIVPYVRGRERSRLPESILTEVRILAEQGTREVQLLGQNVNSYGKDIPELGWNFARLLREVAAIDGVERVRFMTSHPRDYCRELAETIAENAAVCDHIHLPVQSGSDRILKLMNRGYNVAEYLEKIEYTRELMPCATITSDLIVGFPGETEEDFSETIDFIKKVKFDTAYTFIYSKRSGTKAADMPGHLSEDVKKDRLNRLMAAQDPISLARNEAMIGSVVDVMVEGESKTSSAVMSGRTAGNKIVLFTADGLDTVSPGDIKRVRITEVKTWNLLGELV